MIYTIFQCPVTIPYCFMPYDETEFSPADYIPVYKGEISSDVNSRTLEALYEASIYTIRMIITPVLSR